MQNFLKYQKHCRGRAAAARAGFRGLCSELEPCVMCPGVPEPLPYSQGCQAAGTGNVTETPRSALPPTPLLLFHTAVGALNSSWDCCGACPLGCDSQGCDPGRWQQLRFTKPSLAFDPIPHFAKAPGFPLGKDEPESCWQPGTSPSALFRPHHWQ